MLGVLLVGIVMANWRLTRQRNAAAELAHACEIADRLLEKWWSDLDSFPRQDSGAVSGQEGWRWRTTSRTISLAGPANEPAQVVTVEILAPGKEAPAAKVEVLLEEPPGVQEEAP